MLEGFPADLLGECDIREVHVFDRSQVCGDCGTITFNASGVRAESGSSWCAAARRGRTGAGASSSTTWAFVPPMPSELTPARRGARRRRPGGERVLDAERAPAKSISGLGV